MAGASATDGDALSADAQREAVAEYYGRTLRSAADLKTSACCAAGGAPAAHRAVLQRVHPRVRDTFYGCGSPIPDALAAATVLDLGCGTGRDAFLASALVGPAGRVVGVDMTDEQLAVAREMQPYHAEALLGPGVPSNVSFRHGLIEDLAAAGVEPDSVDVVISNCVCNLSPDKPAVFREVARVLRTGGELYFSDIYADRRLSPAARADKQLVAECLGGALYLHDFRRLLADAGLRDPRVVVAAPVAVHDPRMRALVPDVRFYSVTFRAFKLPALDDRPEDYGQTATYTGTDPAGITLDTRFHFPPGEPVPVDANTAAILTRSRYAPMFSVTPPGPHRGLADWAVDGGAISLFISRAVPGPASAAAVQSATACAPPPAQTAAKQANGCCTPAPAPAPTPAEPAGCCGPARASPQEVEPRSEEPAPCDGKKETTTATSCCATKPTEVRAEGGEAGGDGGSPVEVPATQQRCNGGGKRCC